MIRRGSAGATVHRPPAPPGGTGDPEAVAAVADESAVPGE